MAEERSGLGRSNELQGRNDLSREEEESEKWEDVKGHGDDWNSLSAYLA